MNVTICHEYWLGDASTFNAGPDEARVVGNAVFVLAWQLPMFVFFDGREDPAGELGLLYDSRGRGTLVAFGPETLEQGLRLGKVFKGLLEMVGIVAKGDNHFLDRMGDGGRVELKDAKTGGIVGRQR